MDFYNERQQALASVIERFEVGSQEELMALLKSEYGIESTQAMISRDLKVLACVKKIHHDKRIYALPSRDTQQEILRLAIKEIQHNGVMIAVHTEAGLAPFVGDLIDQKGLEIMGCLAGENVVFVSPKKIEEIKSVVEALKSLLGFVKEKSYA